jgi:hypothetical protein
VLPEVIIENASSLSSKIACPPSPPAPSAWSATPAPTRLPARRGASRNPGHRPRRRLDPYEVDLLGKAGLAPVQLGDRILRVETAVTALLSRIF